MKILFVSKFPPIEGGVSANNYWLAKALGSRGNEVSVVTNALCVEDEYKERLDISNHHDMHMLEPAGVRFYSLKEKPPKHIPYSEAYVSRLVNLGLEVAGNNGVDIIYAHYLEPYGTAGFILKKLTGLPFALRHAGSDIYRLLRSEDFRYFLGRVIQGADHLFFSRALSVLTDELGIPNRKISRIPKAIDTEVFSKDGDKFDFMKFGIKIPAGVPIFTYIGKPGMHKAIPEIIEALSRLSFDFRFLFVCGGGASSSEYGLTASQKLGEKFVHLGFVPPWEIPNILRASSALLHLENNFPIPIHSPTQPYEGIACETPMILSMEMFDKIKTYLGLDENDVYIVKNIKDSSELEGIFRNIKDNPESSKEKAKGARGKFLLKNDWKKFIDSYVSIFESLQK